MKNKLYILLFLIFLFSGTALWAQQRATPKSGEGISSFLLRHNRSPKKYYDDFIELNKKKLGKNNVLKVGVTLTFASSFPNKGSLIVVPILVVLALEDLCWVPVPLAVVFLASVFPAEVPDDFFTGGMT